MARTSEQHKGPVPAAGWIKELRHDASGLWGRAEWTATACELMTRKEYRYLSPTFYHNAAGQIMRLSGAGLVHKPALHLKALAQENPPMPAETPIPWSTVIARLLEALGLPRGATEKEALEALDAFAARSAQRASASETPDPRRFVPIEALHDLMAERGTREATMHEADAKAKVEDAFRKGHLTPAMRGWAIALCMSDPGSFDAFVLRSAAAYAHLHKTLLPNGYRSAAQPAAVSDAEEPVCSQLGLKPGRLSNV
jgi:phage I-like protein